jgi:hypothetical protein
LYLQHASMQLSHNHQGNLNSLEFPLYFSVQIILILCIWLSSLFSKFQNIPCLIWDDDDDDHDVFVRWLIEPFHTFYFFLIFASVINIWPLDHAQNAPIFLKNFERKKNIRYVKSEHLLRVCNVECERTFYIKCDPISSPKTNKTLQKFLKPQNAKKFPNQMILSLLRSKSTKKWRLTWGKPAFDRLFHF